MSQQKSNGEDICYKIIYFCLILPCKICLMLLALPFVICGIGGVQQIFGAMTFKDKKK